MNKKVWVKVTEEDILRGEAEDVHFCPIALALARITKDSVQVIVNPGRVEFDYRDQHLLQYWSYSLPTKAQEFIKKFDDVHYDEEGASVPGLVKPFGFQLPIPEEILKEREAESV